MRKISLLLITLLSAGISFAQQSYTIKIIDGQINKALPNVSVLAGSNKGVLSDENGQAVINGETSTSIKLSCIGYKDVTIILGNNNFVLVAMESSVTEMVEVVVLGTRGAARAKTETAVPVDVIKFQQTGMPSARMDLTSVLNMAAPSFNYNKQTGADGADHIDLGTLRGLGPDQTLVLINGKRRHNTAFVALFGTRGRGNSGTDLNGFSQAAVDRIEILRDGASAQYGSDAMAGVMNIVLKKDINNWTINTGWAGNYDDKYNSNATKEGNQYIYGNKIDGGTFTFSANHGIKLNNYGGFLNISFDYLNQAKTYRQVADTNVSTNKNSMPMNLFRRAFGDGSVETVGSMFNMEIPTSASKNTTVYAFGGFNNKASEAFAYTRNYSWNPQRFPIDAQGNLVFDPNIMRVSSDGETYYNPLIQTKINDISLAAGIRGNMRKGWNWDFSNTVGKNDFHYYGDKTFNASMIILPGTERQTRFDDGGFNFLQNTANLDFSKSFSRVAEGLNLGVGAEFRYEHYEIYKGEEASYKQYTNSFGQASGAQGFPGFSPNDEVRASRTNLSFYADAELKATTALLIDGAVRVENYSDFGSVATFKLASRYKVLDNFNLRGSVSTGFRAPSLQQINFSNTLTSFYGTQLVQSRIARNNDIITKAAGIDKLKQETSVNASFGFAWKPIKGLTVTIDGYLIKVKDRIVLSGLFSALDTTLPSALTNEMNALNVATTQFFANSVNTTNYGIDILIDYSKKLSANKSIKALLAGNLQSMRVDKVNIPDVLNDNYVHRKTFFSDREEAFLEASAPNMKFNLTVDYTFKNWTIGTHVNYFGKLKTLGFGWTGLASAAGTGGPGDPAISGSFTGIDPYVDIDGYNDGVNVLKEEFVYNGKATIDLYGSVKLSKKVAVFFGVDNVFNVHPNFAAVQKARYQSFDNETGGAWESVQMGFNGRRLFSKIAFNF
jgi:iron complex outermembrane receptor protein